MPRNTYPVIDGRRAVHALSRSLCAALVLVLVGGCSTVPKPQELVSLEQLRRDRQLKAARKAQATLVAEGERAYRDSVKAWEDEELDRAKHLAVIGAIKLRTALAVAQQLQTRRALKRLKQRLAEQRHQRRQLAEKIREADEKIALYRKLAAAKNVVAKKQKQLTEAQKRAEAERKKVAAQKALAAAQKQVADAQLAIKLADTVEAAKYARALYAVANTLLARAQAALKAQNAADASASAQLARSKAKAAYAKARPSFLKARKTAARKARNQALQKDAAAIAGITVKLKAAGRTQKLILPIPYLFKRRKTAPRRSKLPLLNAVGNLLKKYPNYPVIINGYTSYRVRRRQRYAVSQARAQQVANHFVGMGLKYKRFGLAGRGTETLIGRRYSRANDRVEIVILLF